MRLENTEGHKDLLWLELKLYHFALKIWQVARLDSVFWINKVAIGTLQEPWNELRSERTIIVSKMTDPSLRIRGP